MSSFATLRRLARKPDASEHCDLCGQVLGPEHPHLIEPIARKLICACDPCSFLFPGGSTKYKRVPRYVRFLRHFQLTEGQWDGLMIPIGLAFFMESSPEKRVVALYPSPAGPTESLLSLETWAAIVDENPVLKEMECDVEALLVNRLSEAHEYYIVPIDKCYELVGMIRANWRGFSGGTEVWQLIERFFAALKERAREAANA